MPKKFYRRRNAMVIAAVFSLWFICLSCCLIGSRVLSMFYRPAGAPPNGVVVFVQLSLYGSLALSALEGLFGRVRAGGAAPVNAVAALYAALACLEVVWSAVFFCGHGFFPAILLALALAAAAFCAVRLMLRINAVSAMLAAPWVLWHIYAAWVSFSYWVLAR